MSLFFLPFLPRSQQVNSEYLNLTYLLPTAPTCLLIARLNIARLTFIIVSGPMVLIIFILVMIMAIVILAILIVITLIIVGHLLCYVILLMTLIV